MSDSSKLNPREIYQNRLAARQTEAAECQRWHLLLGYVRLALVIAGIAVAWCSFYQHSMSRWWLLAISVVFVVVVRRHSAVLHADSHVHLPSGHTLPRRLRRVPTM